jgi:ubiquinone/menaquinone biosynthesis C-methylase UbiE
MSNQAIPEQASDAGSLIPLLDAVDALPAARALRARSYQLLRPSPGSLVLDVGCGAGRAVAELNQHGVTALGVDPDQAMLAAAHRRWPDADFRAGHADNLPVGDGVAAGYRADKVYHALPEPTRALAEARRVLAPGGRIVLVGQDWDTLVIDSDDPGLTRAIVHARADLVPNPRAARGYRNLLLDAGFTDVALEVHTGVFTDTTMLPMLTALATAANSTGTITREQAEAWSAEQTRRAQNRRLLLAIPIFLASAQRP